MGDNHYIDTAATLVGIPFKADGRTREGLDCLGVVLMLYEMYERPVPDLDVCFSAGEGNACQMAEMLPLYTDEIPAPEIEPLDLVVFRGSMENHFGVALGFDRFLHVQEEVGVLIHRIPQQMTHKVLSKVLRVKDERDWPHSVEAISESTDG